MSSFATAELAASIRGKIRAAVLLTASRRDYAADVAVLADVLSDAGDEDGARRARAGDWQETAEGTEVVTVGRFGARTVGTGNGHSVGIWATKVYRATRRQSDGNLTWRLCMTIGGHSTAGREVTKPMRERARREADERELEFLEGVKEHQLCD
jgi:hypothetical protein